MSLYRMISFVLIAIQLAYQAQAQAQANDSLKGSWRVTRNALDAETERSNVTAFGDNDPSVKGNTMIFNGKSVYWRYKDKGGGFDEACQVQRIRVRQPRQFDFICVGGEKFGPQVNETLFYLIDRRHLRIHWYDGLILYAIKT